MLKCASQLWEVFVLFLSFSHFVFRFCFCFFSPAPFDMCRVSVAEGRVVVSPLDFSSSASLASSLPYCFYNFILMASVGLRLESVSRHVCFLASLLSIDCFVVVHLLMRQYWMSGLQKPI